MTTLNDFHCQQFTRKTKRALEGRAVPHARWFEWKWISSAVVSRHCCTRCLGQSIILLGLNFVVSLKSPIAVGARDLLVSATHLYSNLCKACFIFFYLPADSTLTSVSAVNCNVGSEPLCCLNVLPFSVSFWFFQHVQTKFRALSEESFVTLRPQQETMAFIPYPVVWDLCFHFWLGF